MSYFTTQEIGLDYADYDGDISSGADTEDESDHCKTRKRSSKRKSSAVRVTKRCVVSRDSTDVSSDEKDTEVDSGQSLLSVDSVESRTSINDVDTPSEGEVDASLELDLSDGEIISDFGKRDSDQYGVNTGSDDEKEVDRKVNADVPRSVTETVSCRLEPSDDSSEGYSSLCQVLCARKIQLQLTTSHVMEIIRMTVMLITRLQSTQLKNVLKLKCRRLISLMQKMEIPKHLIKFPFKVTLSLCLRAAFYSMVALVTDTTHHAMAMAMT